MNRNKGSVLLSLLMGIVGLILATAAISVYFADNYLKGVYYKNIGGYYYKHLTGISYKFTEGGLGIFPNVKYVKVEGARKKYFSVIKNKENKASEYGKDDKSIFYKEKKIVKADSTSFIALASDLGKDKNAYFIGNQTASEYLRSISDIIVSDSEIKFHYIKEFDPRLLEISSKYYVLAGYPYLYPLDIIDYESFTPNVVKMGQVSGGYRYSLGKDKNFEYLFISAADNLLSVRPVNKNATFRQDVSSYFIDFEGKLYLNGKLVNGQYRSGTLRKLKSDLVESNYFKDNKHVYYKDRKIGEADRESFKVIINTRQHPGYNLKYIADFAVDKNYKYHMGNKITSVWPVWEREYDRAMQSFIMYIE